MNKKTLSDTDAFLSSIKKKTKAPSEINLIYYLLAKEFGFSLKDIAELPIPYLYQLLGTHNYIKEFEAKEYKKQQKKK